MTWKVYHDRGHGVTIESLEFFKRNIKKLGSVIKVQIDFDREFSMEIHGMKGIMLLSGCNCGYGGEGPNGSKEVLERLGVPVSDKAWSSTTLFHYRHITYDFRTNTVTV